MPRPAASTLGPCERMRVKAYAVGLIVGQRGANGRPAQLHFMQDALGVRIVVGERPAAPGAEQEVCVYGARRKEVRGRSLARG